LVSGCQDEGYFGNLTGGFYTLYVRDELQCEEVVEFSYDMMKRFQVALEPVSEPQGGPVFIGKPPKVAVETAEVVEETKETFVSKKTADGTTVFENNVGIRELMEE
jgi:hypothetical protein